jgi:hypothetical protein
MSEAEDQQLHANYSVTTEVFELQYNVKKNTRLLTILEDGVALDKCMLI